MACGGPEQPAETLATRGKVSSGLAARAISASKRRAALPTPHPAVLDQTANKTEKRTRVELMDGLRLCDGTPPHNREKLLTTVRSKAFGPASQPAQQCTKSEELSEPGRRKLNNR